MWRTVAPGLMICLLLFCCGCANDRADEPGMVKATSLEELEKLPVGLEVVHQPNPVRATLSEDNSHGRMYTWSFKTTVSPTGAGVRIVEFGGYVWHEGKWVFKTFTGEPFTANEFAEWYSCRKAYLKADKSYADPRNWVRASELRDGKTRWYYIGIDDNGRRVKGESVVVLKGEIDPTRESDPKQ